MWRYEQATVAVPIWHAGWSTAPEVDTHLLFMMTTTDAKKIPAIKSENGSWVWAIEFWQ